MSNQISTLLRGKACITCRRRKMRCDGLRPHCSQCTRSRRPADCEYTDNQGRPRIQVLEENIASLQARIHELENPSSIDPNVILRNPYAEERETELRLSQTNVNTLQWWELDEPPSEIREYLINIFIPYSPCLGFVISMQRFRSRLVLNFGHDLRPHTSLINTVLLWAFRLSRSPDLVRHEGVFFQRAIVSLQNVSSACSGNENSINSYRYIEAIQAEILLAYYLFSSGRNLEGRYHTNAAISLAYLGVSVSHVNELTPPQDSLELGERIRVFWCVFILDRYWSTALDEPSALVDEAQFGTPISTPWPLDLESYLSSVPAASSTRPVQQLLSGDLIENDVVSCLSNHAKISALFERAAYLSKKWETGNQPLRVELSNEARKLVGITSQFVQCLTPVDQIVLGRVDDACSGSTSLLLVHGLAHATMISLIKFRLSVSSMPDLNALNIALSHCNAILVILEKLSSLSLPFVNPMFSVLGSIAAVFFITEEQRIQEAKASIPIAEAQEQINMLQLNINRTIKSFLQLAESTGFTVFRNQVEKIESSWTNAH